MYNGKEFKEHVFDFDLEGNTEVIITGETCLKECSYTSAPSIITLSCSSIDPLNGIPFKPSFVKVRPDISLEEFTMGKKVEYYSKHP